MRLGSVCSLHQMPEHALSPKGRKHVSAHSSSISSLFAFVRYARWVYIQPLANCKMVTASITMQKALMGVKNINRELNSDESSPCMHTVKSPVAITWAQYGNVSLACTEIQGCHRVYSWGDQTKLPVQLPTHIYLTMEEINVHLWFALPGDHKFYQS